MIEMFIRNVLEVFSIRLLYLVTTWFFCCGYVFHTFIVHVIARLPVTGIMRTVFLLHTQAVIVSFLLAPIFTVLTYTLFGYDQQYFSGQFLLIWYVVIQAYVASYFFCATFVTNRCMHMRRLILGGNICLGLLVYFLMRVFNLLVMI